MFCLLKFKCNVNSGSTIKTLTSHTNSIWYLEVLQDGSLASGSDDNAIRHANISLFYHKNH